MNLEKFIYEFNLASTMVAKDNVDWACILNNKINKEIDYENSISFYNLVDSFNKLYLKFKNDYNKLDKWNLGKYKVLDVYSKEGEEGLYRSLVIYIDEPDKMICDYDETLLYIVEKNEEIYGRITNNLNYFDKNYYNKKIDIDKNKASKYLDFFLRYKLFTDAYDFFKIRTIWGNGTTMIFSKICGDMFEEHCNFELSFGNCFFNYEDYIKVVFELGDELRINYNDSTVIFESKMVDDKKDIIDMLVNNLYIHRCKLSMLYDSGYIKKLTKY